MTEAADHGAMAPLLATFTVQTMAAMALFGVAVIAPVAAPDIGVDATLIGTFTAITYAFGMVSGLLTGAFADRYGAIRVCQTIMVFTLVGTACLTLSTPIAAAASAAVLGLCYGPVNPVSKLCPESSAKRFRPCCRVLSRAWVARRHQVSQRRPCPAAVRRLASSARVCAPSVVSC